MDIRRLMPTFDLGHRPLARHSGTALLALLWALPLLTLPARAQYLIGGRVLDGSIGVSNVTVQAIGQTFSQITQAITDTNGNYSLAFQQSDSYTVAPVKQGMVFQ